MSLRTASADDLPFLRELYHSLRADELAAVTWTPARKAMFLDEQFRLQHADWVARYVGADFLVVRQGAAPEVGGSIGRLYLDRTAPAWRLIDIGLLPRARGAGIGRALLGWVQSAAVAAGADGVGLHVLASNPRAQALYRRLGFRIEGDAHGLRRSMVWSASRLS